MWLALRETPLVSGEHRLISMVTLNVLSPSSLTGVYESVGARGRPKRKDSDQILNSPLQIASNRPGTAQTTLKQSYFSQNDHNPASTIAGELIALDRVIWSSVQSDNSVRYCLSLDGVEPIPSLLTVLEQLVYLTVSLTSFSTHCALLMAAKYRRDQ